MVTWCRNNPRAIFVVPGCFRTDEATGAVYVNSAWRGTHNYNEEHDKGAKCNKLYDDSKQLESVLRFGNGILLLLLFGDTTSLKGSTIMVLWVRRSIGDILPEGSPR